jgi:hypothetical protein
MKLKIFIVVAVIAMVGGSLTVLVRQSQSAHRKFAPPASQLPTAMSNYSKTFKLNTSPPLWPGTNGVTNGNATN